MSIKASGIKFDIKINCIYLHLAWSKRFYTMWALTPASFMPPSLCPRQKIYFRSLNTPFLPPQASASEVPSVCTALPRYLCKAGSLGPIRFQEYSQSGLLWKLSWTWSPLSFSLMDHIFHFITLVTKKILFILFPLDCKLHQGRKHIDKCYEPNVYVPPKLICFSLNLNVITGGESYGR